MLPVADEEMPEDEVESTGEGGLPLETEVLVDGTLQLGKTDPLERLHELWEQFGCQILCKFIFQELSVFVRQVITSELEFCCFWDSTSLNCGLSCFLCCTFPLLFLLRVFPELAGPVG
jgi:hypothetical protein